MPLSAGLPPAACRTGPRGLPCLFPLPPLPLPLRRGLGERARSGAGDLLGGAAAAHSPATILTQGGRVTVNLQLSWQQQQQQG